MKFTDFLTDKSWSCALSFELSNAYQISLVQENQLNEFVGDEFFRVYFFYNYKIAHKKWISLIICLMKRDVFLFRKSYHALFEYQIFLKYESNE